MKRILVILDNCHEADAIRLLPCVDAIRRQHHSAHLTLLVNERAAAVFERHRPFDRLVTSRLYQERTASGLRLKWRKVREMARLMVVAGAGYDLAITLGVGSTLLNLFARGVARRSVGFANRFPRLLSSSLGRFDPYAEPLAQHDLLLQACGVETVPARLASIRTPEDERDAMALLAQRGLDPNRLVVLHTGSDWACQQWLGERWAAFADAIVAEFDAQVAFTGVAAEAGYVERVRALMKRRSVSLVGETPLGRLEAILTLARLCVCVDSAVYDLAIRTDTPVVVLAGASDAARPQYGGSRPIVVDRTPADLKDRINRCKEPKDIFGGCLDYGCPMAGLRDIPVAAVLAVVRAREPFGVVPSRDAV